MTLTTARPGVDRSNKRRVAPVLGPPHGLKFKERPKTTDARWDPMHAVSPQTFISPYMLPIWSIWEL